ncbi:MAG: EAL domain-containing protein [Spirochaetia bacterium]|nr:EAL domain-containing protein [Spirochaetia bacterium]
MNSGIFKTNTFRLLDYKIIFPVISTIALVFISRINYPLFHTLAELFASAVAVLMFVVVWHTFNISQNSYLLYMGSGFFWIGVLDLLHALSYKGVSIIPTSIPDLSIQIWIAARSFEALLMLTSVYFLKRKVKKNRPILFLAALSAVLTLVIFFGYFPTTFIEGSGLTPFKIYSEYAIIAVLFSSIALIYYNRKSFDSSVMKIMVASIAMTIASESAFTYYVDLFGFSNMLGHLFKLISFWMIYLAIIQNTLTEPYKIMSRSSSIFDSIPEIILLVGHNGSIQNMNESTHQISGLDPERILDQNVHELFHDRSIQQKNCIICEHIQKGTSLRNQEIYFPGKDLWHEVSVTPYEFNTFHGMIQINKNITLRKKSEEKLFEEMEKAQVTLHSIGDGVITTDLQGNVLFINPVGEEMTGWVLDEARLKPINEILPLIDEKTGKNAENPVFECIKNNSISRIMQDCILINKKGNEFAVEDSASPIRDRNGEVIGAIMVFRDVSTERVLKNRLSYHARHDSLTGLFNRYVFEEKLGQIIEDSRVNKTEHSLAYLDLDQFKVLNDTCGHIAGDELLKQIGPILRKHIRDSDIISRLGGDEFGIILEFCPIEQAKIILEKTREELKNARFSWENRSFEISASIGLTNINCESKNISTVLAQADMACYTSKESGRNRIHLFTDQDQNITKHQTEMQWVASINSALEQDRFQLYSQCIIPLGVHKDHKHHEILLRMVDEEGQIIEPDIFLPAADRYNIINKIDRWVIKKVFSTFSRMHFESEREIISINLSGPTVSDPKTLEFIQSLIHEYQIDPNRICFEITETSAISNLHQASELINSLKEMGCLFALDDFGTGVSSLSYLRNLNIDYVKIDGSFIRSINSDAICLAMVNSIKSISSVMGIKTIAEYVENKEILDKLNEIGVNFAQGFHIETPKPLVYS